MPSATATSRAASEGADAPASVTLACAAWPLTDATEEPKRTYTPLRVSASSSACCSATYETT